MGDRVSWDALRVFVTAVRAGSLSAAARELGLAQSSVSEQIARLERSLGHALLLRGPGGVRPTDQGRDLVTRISDAVDGLAAVTAPSAGAGSGTRPVTLGGPAEFLSEVLLPPLLERLAGDVEVAVRFGVADDAADQLRHGALDVAVSAVPIRGRGIAAEPIYDEEFVLVAHPRWAGRAADGLETIPVLAYGPELPIIRRYWRSEFHRRPSALRLALVAPDLRTLLRAALGGAGMTVLPDYLARDHLDAGALAQLHVPADAPLNTLFVATRRDATAQDPAVLRVREAIVEIARAAGRPGQPPS